MMIYRIFTFGLR